MSTQLFFPIPAYVSHIKPNGLTMTLEELCVRAGVACAATGAWTRRRVTLVRNQHQRIWVETQPSKGVLIECVDNPQSESAARYALAVMAYAVNDLVARQSIRPAEWKRPRAKLGRPRSGRAMNNRERQRRFQRDAVKRR